MTPKIFVQFCSLALKMSVLREFNPQLSGAGKSNRGGCRHFQRHVVYPAISYIWCSCYLKSTPKNIAVICVVVISLPQGPFCILIKDGWALRTG